MDKCKEYVIVDGREMSALWPCGTNGYYCDRCKKDKQIKNGTNKKL